MHIKHIENYDKLDTIYEVNESALFFYKKKENVHIMVSYKNDLRSLKKHISFYRS
jgi:hypothetical protein